MSVSDAADPCSFTRAACLVRSEMIDIAAEISSLASSLTGSAITSIQTRISERGHEASRMMPTSCAPRYFTGSPRTSSRGSNRGLKRTPKRRAGPIERDS